MKKPKQTMTAPSKPDYAQSDSEKQKSRYQSLLDQGVDEKIAWRIVFDEPDSNQPYINWPKAELEALAADKGITNFREISKRELIEVLQTP